MGEKKAIFSQQVQIEVEGAQLIGDLCVPPDAKGIVLFAHGSGSSRLSPRNQYVAKILQDESLATLLFDLLTEEEERQDLQTHDLRFNIPFLADRLSQATEWINNFPETHSLTIGYFGASTGAAAALIAAAEKGAHIGAVVSRGGRPDLAAQSLPKVQAPTLLIVGGEDFGVIELNQRALEMLGCKKRLEIVPNATHLFEEPGTLEEVARMAKIWFAEHL